VAGAQGSFPLGSRACPDRRTVPRLHGRAGAYLYATLHYVATPATLVWIAVRRRGAYAVARNALLIATAIGLLGYRLLPTAPPRLVGAGLTDTMAVFSDLGWWGGAASAPRGMESLSNQYAAMPSLHVGWAVWVAACLGVHARRRLVRRWAWTYPALMALVVMATANQYLLDVVAGTGCAVLGVLLTRSRAGRRTTTSHEGRTCPSWTR
jgi:hypothetical protein